jgi:hypothetical protein
MKIKTFQFLLSNFGGNDVYNYDPRGYTPRKSPETEREIDRKLNRWIEKNNPVIHDIKITTYTVNRHNNGMNDTVIAIYTITYDPAEPERDHGNTDDSADYGN